MLKRTGNELRNRLIKVFTHANAIFDPLQVAFASTSARGAAACLARQVARQTGTGHRQQPSGERKSVEQTWRLPGERRSFPGTGRLRRQAMLDRPSVPE